MKSHRDELRGRLRSVLGRLDLGLSSLRKQGSRMKIAGFQPTKEAYGALLETLSEIESPPSPPHTVHDTPANPDSAGPSTPTPQP